MSDYEEILSEALLWNFAENSAAITSTVLQALKPYLLDNEPPTAIDWTDRRVHELWCKRDEPVLPYSSDRVVAYHLLERICDEYRWGFNIGRRYCNKRRALILSVEVESMPTEGELFGARFGLQECESYTDFKYRRDGEDLTANTICRLLIGVAEKMEDMGVFTESAKPADPQSFNYRFPSSRLRPALRRQDQQAEHG